MNIEIKKSQNPVKYEEAITFMENRLHEISEKNSNNLSCSWKRNNNQKR